MYVYNIVTDYVCMHVPYYIINTPTIQYVRNHLLCMGITILVNFRGVLIYRIDKISAADMANFSVLAIGIF